MSDYKVFWQDEAYSNLLTIREQIEKVSCSAEIENKLLGVIYERTEELANFPNRYPVYPDRPALRRMVINRDYCVFYRVIEETKIVRVFNILRSAADAPQHIGEDA